MKKHSDDIVFRSDRKEVDERTKNIVEKIVSGKGLRSAFFPSWEVAGRVMSSSGRPDIAKNLEGCYSDDPGLLQSEGVSPAVLVWADPVPGKKAGGAIPMMHKSFPLFLDEVARHLSKEARVDSDMYETITLAFELAKEASEVIGENRFELLQAGARARISVEQDSDRTVFVKVGTSAGMNVPEEEKTVVIGLDGKVQGPEGGVLPTLLGSVEFPSNGVKKHEAPEMGQDKKMEKLPEDDIPSDGMLL